MSSSRLFQASIAGGLLTAVLCARSLMQGFSPDSYMTMDFSDFSGILTTTSAEESLNLRSVGDEQYYRKVVGWPRTLLVHIHSWSGTKDECLSTTAFEALQNVVWVCPHFGGPNNYPEAAGHPAQLERIKRVIDAVKAEFPMIERTILYGQSGGGYVALMLLAAYPGIAYGASLWVFPFDLADWWTQKTQYRESLEACFLGTPAQKPDDYYVRSPVSRSISGVRMWINGSEDDTEIPYSHLTGARDRFSPDNTVTFRDFSGGHITQWPEAVAQIQGMQP